MKKRLCKSTEDKKICGVCAGFADYLNIDPTIVRVVYAVLSLTSSGFPGILLYFILAFILPADDE